jgi:hypothetical protein
VTDQPPKAGQLVDPGADLVGQRAAFSTELPHLAREGADQTAAAEGQHSCCLVQTTAVLTNLHKQQTYLSSQLQLTSWTEDQILPTNQSLGETT